MRSDNQSGWGSGARNADGNTEGTDTNGTDFGGADFGGPLPGPPGSGGGKRPWFGPKRIGWGYRPQTWQGWAVTGLMVLVVAVAAPIARGTPWFYAVLVAVIAVPFAIIAWQRR